MWKIVVLPAPSGPINPKISPRLILKSTPCTASNSLYFLRRALTITTSSSETGGRFAATTSAGVMVSLRAGYDVGVRRHTRFTVTGRVRYADFYPEHLLDAIIPEINILRSE